MIIFHIIGAFTLIIVTLALLIRSLQSGSNDDQDFVMYGGFIALAWAIVVFTGFIQIGSQHSPGSIILYKMGSTLTGGIFALFGVFGRVKNILHPVFFLILECCALLAFLMSLYWALIL